MDSYNSCWIRNWAHFSRTYSSFLGQLYTRAPFAAIQLSSRKQLNNNLFVWADNLPNNPQPISFLDEDL